MKYTRFLLSCDYYTTIAVNCQVNKCGAVALPLVNAVFHFGVCVCLILHAPATMLKPLLRDQLNCLNGG